MNQECEDRRKYARQGHRYPRVVYGTELGSMSFGAQGLGNNP